MERPFNHRRRDLIRIGDVAPVAPFFGKLGGTADFARAEGEAANEVRFVLGVRTWW